MNAAVTTIAPNDKFVRVREALAAKSDGVLESIASEHGVTYREVLDCLDGDGVASTGSASFDDVWANMTSWGKIMLIVHTKDGVFETAGTLPPGTHGHGYYNIHGDSPIGGHLMIDRCAAIYFIDRPFFGKRSCSVQFLNIDGAAMFKVFVGRDESRQLKPDQLTKFEALRQRLCS